MRSISRCAVVVFVLTLAFSAQAATTIKYAAPGGTGAGTSWSDTAELRTLLAATVSPPVGDTVEIWVAAGVYKPTTTTDRNVSFVLKNRVELYGGFVQVEKARDQRNPLSNLTILSGEIGGAVTSDNSQHVLTGTNCDSSAILDGFVVRDGYSADYGGGLSNVTASPTVSNCIFINNQAIFGGAISNRTGASPVISACRFDDNLSSSIAGAIYNDDSSPAISNCMFNRNIAGLRNNVATRAGAIHYENSQCVLKDCSFNSNKGGDGAAVYIGDDCDVTVRNCTFDSNTSANDVNARGALYCVFDCLVLIEDCTFTSNVCGSGGGIDSGADVGITINRCTFTNNKATTVFSGGAINHSFAAKMTVNDSTFAGNTSADGGGAIHMGDSTLELNNCRFTENVCVARGGAIDALESSDLRINNCIFSGNKAGFGGALSHGYTATVVRVANSLFESNTAGEGGVILNVNSLNFAAVNCTFANNSATTNGGGVVSNRGTTPVFKNCIFWGNTANIAPVVLGNASTITYSCVQGGYAGTGNISADPQFLYKFPGSYRLHPTSPCIDAALGTGAPTLDALGRARVDLPDVPNTGSGTPEFVDMGAFERQPSSLTFDTGSIAENAVIGTSAGSFNGVGSDLGFFTFTLVAGAGSADNDQFTINGSSLTSAAVFDFETKSSYSVRVRLTDSNGVTLEAPFTVAVTNVKEAPTALVLSANLLPENSAIGTAVGTLSSVDPDVGETFTYALVAGPGDQQNSFFAIDGSTLRVAGALDFEARSTYSVLIRTTDSGGQSLDAVRIVTITDVPDIIPQLESGPSYLPANVFEGQLVTFTCAASNAAAYTWSFGDGVLGFGATVTHAFQVAGTYTVTVALTSADGVTISKTVDLTVQPLSDPGADPDNDGIPNSLDPDSDNDGFSDAMEVAIGTNPYSATSTPIGAGATPGQFFPLAVSKLSIKLNFSGEGRDAIQLRGTVEIPAGFTVANQKCAVDVGGVVRAFTLTDKGRAGTSSESLKLAVKRKKLLVPAQTALFQVDLKKGAFAAQLADDGLGNESVRGKSVNVPIVFVFNGQEFRKLQVQMYSAKAGSSGKTK